MATTVRELINVIGFKVDDNQLKNAENKTGKFMKGLKTVGLAVGASIIAIGTLAVRAASDMEALTAQFEVMLGDSEKAIALMEELKGFAASTPFALKDLAKGTQNLIAFGVPAEKALDTMRMLGDTAGGNAEKLQSLVLAYGKVQTKGKVSMEEINMIAERGVPIIGTLQKQLGVTEQAFFKLISAGKVGRKEIQLAFKTMTSEGGIFFEGMKTASLTFAGMVSTMKDNITLLLAAIGTKLLPTMKLVVETITKLFQGSLGDIISDLLKVIDPILKIVLELASTLLDGVMPLVKLLSDLLVPLLKIVTILLEPINEVLGILLEGIGDIAGELIGLMIPLLEEVAVLFTEMMPLLMPILRIFTKLFVFFLKMKVLLNTLFFRIWIKGLTLILKMLRPIIKLISLFLVPAFELLEKVLIRITTFLEKIIDNIIQGIVNSITFVLELLNMAIQQINKLPFMEEKKIVPFDVGAIQDKMIKKDEQNQQNNINMTSNNTFNGLDNNKKGNIKKEVREAIGTPFQLEILRVVQEL